MIPYARTLACLLAALALAFACSRANEAAPQTAQKPKASPIAQGMSGDREELRYLVTIEADDPSYALKRLKALPAGFAKAAQQQALALTRDNPLDIERVHYLEFLRILQELGALQVEKQSFLTKEPAGAPIPFVLRVKAAPTPAAKEQKAGASSPDSRSRRAP